MIGHRHPERHSGAELFSNAIHLLAEQHVGLDGVDLVALLNLAAVAVARGSKADCCHVPSVERVGVGLKVAALKLLNELQRRS